MTLNKKRLYVGITLFSSAILASVVNIQTAKAATTASDTIQTSTTASQTALASATSPKSTSAENTTVTTATSVASQANTGSSQAAATEGTVPTSTSVITSSQPATTTATAKPQPETSASLDTTGTGSQPVSTTTITSSQSTTTPASTAGLQTVSGTPTSTTIKTSSTQPAATGTTSTSTITTGGTAGTGTLSTTNPEPTGTINVNLPSENNSYAIPSDVSDSTVVNFTDPLLESVIKNGLHVKATDNITVGAIKNFKDPLLGASVTMYQLGQLKTPGASMTDQDSTPIESLNGMQYLQLLPAKSQIILQVKLATDAKANQDLTPLDNLNFNHLTIDGNFSNPKAKEIDVSQIPKINVSKATYVEFTGDTSVSTYSGINDQQLKKIGPWLTKFVNNGNQGNMVELGSAALSDFSPLKNIDPNAGALIVSFNDGTYDPVPVYGVIGQPLTFKALPSYGIAGEDIADTYHFTYTVDKSKWADDNLENLGNDQYQIENPDSSNNTLIYGHLGFMCSSNPDSYIQKKYGTNTFEYFGVRAQPLIWQNHPTVTINYLNADGTPIENQGTPMTKQLSGNLVGDKFDLTSDSVISGYNLQSAATVLKGMYALNPQVVNLVYSRIPATSSSNTTSVKNVSSTDTRILALDYQAASETLKSIGVRATALVNGRTFYLVGYGQWIAADTYNFTKTATSGIVRISNTAADVVDSYGDLLANQLAPNSAWKYSQIVTINGADYYQIASNVFVSVKGTIDFSPVSDTTKVTVISQTPIYNTQGQTLPAELPIGSKWRTDGSAVINGVKMYRVATDEWVSAADVQVQS